MARSLHGSLLAKKWFYPNITGQDAENILERNGVNGSFVIRPSRSTPGDFALSVRHNDKVKHIKIHNQGDYYDLYGGEKFATLAELTVYYAENPGQLKESNGTVIELDQPLCFGSITTERWYYSGFNGRDAEVILMSKGRDGSYLVRPCLSSPGNYVLCIRTGEEVAHIFIRHADKQFDLGGGPSFPSLNKLVKYYNRNPFVDTSGHILELRFPLYTTAFLLTHLKLRVYELEKVNNGETGFWEEFEQLQQQETRHLYSRKKGSKCCNLPKNRFKHILPFDHTLVTLSGGDPNVPGSDYINASYINGEVPSSEQYYIATQGCLPGTIGDFWTMVWQQGSLIIVMITNLVRNGRNQCAQYWPDREESKVYGSICVTNVEEAPATNYIIRHFLVHHEKEEGDRDVYHFQFTAWPDHGVPNDPRPMLEYMNYINRKFGELKDKGSSPGPIVVHCSSGIGRTGTYIIIDTIISIINHQGMEAEIDVQQSVLLSRGQRSGMVQTVQQYRFVYQAILQYVENIQQPSTS